MLKFTTNHMKKGDLYSCNVNKTMNEREFIEQTGITQSELDAFKVKLDKFYTTRFKIISDYPCLYVCSGIINDCGQMRVMVYNLITTDEGNFHYAVSDYCKAMIPKVNAFGIEHKEVNYSSFNGLYIMSRSDVINVNNFIVRYIGNQIVVKYNIECIGDVISIDLVNKEITVLNKDFKPTPNEQTYLNMICQIYCQDKKFMLDVLEDNFVLITA